MSAPAHIARENGKKGGRPVGTASLLSRRKQEDLRQLFEQGKTPLDVLISNMLIFHDEALNLTEQLKQMAPQFAAMVNGPEKLEALKQMIETQQKMFAARDKSGKFAVDAAPYVHARLAAIVPAPKPDPNDPNTPGSLPKTLEATSPTEAAIVYQRLIGGNG